MKKLILIALLSIAFAGEKAKPVYTQRSVLLKNLEARANQLAEERKKATDALNNIDKEMLVIQGQYSAFQAMPDSFILRPDSLRSK